MCATCDATYATCDATCGLSLVDILEEDLLKILASYKWEPR